MAKLSQIEVQSCTLWLTATYEDDDGEEYEIVFTKTCEDNLGYEEREVVNIEKDGEEVDSDNPVWEEIGEAVKQLSADETEPYRQKFTIEIEQGWLDALQGMAEAIVEQPVHTPEGALEFSIFAQLQKQLPAIGQEQEIGRDGEAYGNNPQGAFLLSGHQQRVSQKRAVVSEV